jgi:hypothetical protein
MIYTPPLALHVLDMLVVPDSGLNGYKPNQASIDTAKRVIGFMTEHRVPITKVSGDQVGEGGVTIEVAEHFELCCTNSGHILLSCLGMPSIGIDGLAGCAKRSA